MIIMIVRIPVKLVAHLAMVWMIVDNILNLLKVYSDISYANSKQVRFVKVHRNIVYTYIILLKLFFVNNHDNFRAIWHF